MFDLQKPWPLGLDRKSWPAFLLAIVVILAALSALDIWASRGAIGWPQSWRAPFFVVTDYGLSDWVLIPSLIGLVLARLAMFPLRGLPRLVAFQASLLSSFIFAGVAVPGLIVVVLKRLVGRARPTEFETSGAFSFQNFLNDWTFQSFPSGHSATAIAMAFTAGFLWPRAFIPLLILGITAAVSRVPVGMHYPTDVFAGCVVGMLGAYLVRNFYARTGWLFRQQPDGRFVRKPLAAFRRLAQRARA